MAIPSNDAKSADADGRSAFLEHLEQRIAAIEDNWGDLRSGRWDQELLLPLYTRVRELSDAANDYGLVQLGESVFSAEVYLSSFVDASSQPSPQQEEEIDGLIRAMRAAAEDLLQRSTDPSPPDAVAARTVYLFGPAAEPLQQLAQAIAERGGEVQRFADPGAFVAAMDAQLPQVIVADTALLDQVAPISTELVRLNTQQAETIPLVFVSDTKELAVRVEAMRAGGSAYFVHPIDAAAVAEQVLRLARPKEPEAYRVMVVEDDPTQAEFAASILRKSGMQVMKVTEPLRVMDALEEFRPDLILMDIYMPDVNGIELTSIIREHNDFVVTPIVFLSGEQSADKQLAALTVGGDDFVAKPIRPKHLLTVVKHRIMRSRNMQRVAGTNRKQDRVTGLFSRRHLLDRLAKLLETGAARETPGGILHLMPDQAAQVREGHGLGAADTLLADLSERLRGALEPQDVACRMDDQGIAVLLRRDTPAALQALAKRLLGLIAAQPFDVDGSPMAVTASIGICPFDENSEDAEGLAARAERACQEAHAAGGNIVRQYREEPEPAVAAAAAAPKPAPAADPVTAALREAVANDGLVVHYQPLLDLQARGRENYELLLKLPMPNGDLLGERDLRAPAAAAGLLGRLDRWLVQRALDLLHERREAGRRMELFVRQSGATVKDADFPSWLAGQLRARQMVGTGLVLDFRLADLSHDLKTAERNLGELRRLDVAICISRFPEKPAAFKVLKFLNAGYIEVAPRLLKADQATISSIVDQAHALDAKVIVANIDDPRSVDLHWSSGADYLQGNFIQRPLEHMDYDFYQIVV